MDNTPIIKLTLLKKRHLQVELFVLKVYNFNQTRKYI